MQVHAKAAALNSGDCFILETPHSLHVWNGQYSSDDEQALAKSVAARLCSLPIRLVAEGQEPADFWAVLGGKLEYTTIKEDEPGGSLGSRGCSSAPTTRASSTSRRSTTLPRR